jgi:hypothetical protein
MTRSDKDFYETPEAATYPIMAECIMGGPADDWHVVLDLGCGDGRLGRAATAAYEFADPDVKGTTYGVEIDPERAEIASRNGVLTSEGPLEFFDHQQVPAPDLVISNPPFSEALEFLEFAHAYKSYGHHPEILFLLPVGYLGSRGRHAFWKANPPDAMRVFSKRLSFTGDGKTANADYAWFYWGGALQGIDFYP